MGKTIKATMYRKPKFLQVLHRIRERMSREVDYDVDLFAEMIRSGALPTQGPTQNIRGFKRRAPRDDKTEESAGTREPRKRAAR
jgi:hypothetical protein